MVNKYYEIFPAGYENELNLAKEKLAKENVVNRLWKKDHTLWSDKPDEITNRLDWLTITKEIAEKTKEVETFVSEVKNFEYVLLLGMGGSSLAPEVFSMVFGQKEGFPKVYVLDSTDPGRVADIENKIEHSKTLFIVSTKSGGTVETISFMKYFYRKTVNLLGEKAGNYFAAITDPGSGLQKMAEDLKFRKIFLNNPNIGGRFSALSFFGIVPAALTGVSVKEFIAKTDEMIASCKIEEGNPAAEIGAFTGLISKKGVDKLTFILDDSVKSLGAWTEQLIAESTGKVNNGILPVDGGYTEDLNVFKNDRCFVFVFNGENKSLEDKMNKVLEAGFPVIKTTMESRYDLGQQFFLWEFATAVMGWSLAIHPFDQPDVESAKVQARAMLTEYQEKGKLPVIEKTFEEEDYSVSTNVNIENKTTFIDEFINKSLKEEPFRSYISVQAYLNPDEQTTNKLMKICDTLRDKYSVAVTLGFGPRFLHSTGQLHKGDTGNGIFLQFTSDKKNDVSIPDSPETNDSSVSFGVLVNAQAMGDRQALLNNNRNIMTVNIKTDVGDVLNKLS